MAIFQYTVANKQGKKLSGTVEAPDKQVAKEELNNLGFSILSLEETNKIPQPQKDIPKFIFESLDKNSKIVQGTISAQNREAAIEKLTQYYNVSIIAIWPDGATQEEIELARQQGQVNLQQQALQQTQTSEDTPTPEQQVKKQQIQTVLSELKTFLTQFKDKFSPETQTEINKKLNKLLRIKNSNNLEYISQNIDELIYFIREKDNELLEQNHKQERFKLKIQTKQLLNDLHQEQKKQTLSQDIVEKIENWQSAHITNEEKPTTGKLWLNKILEKIKNFFHTPIEILTLKEQIKTYNKQIWEFRKIYYKEPTKEYKSRAANSIKIIKKAKAKAKQNLKEIKTQLRNQKLQNQTNRNQSNFWQELTTLSGWLLAFYIIIYVTGLYLNTKNFNLAQIPQIFNIYETRIFKYLLIITFLLHCSLSLHLTYFKKNKISSITFTSLTLIFSLLTIFNF